MATYEDFQKLDIRVGQIVGVEDFPEARKPAYKLKVDLGSEIGVKNPAPSLRKTTQKKILEENEFFAWLTFLLGKWVPNYLKYLF